jgi:hypothetical protein
MPDPSVVQTPQAVRSIATATRERSKAPDARFTIESFAPTVTSDLGQEACAGQCSCACLCSPGGGDEDPDASHSSQALPCSA